ncbi:diguanylate cyclase with GAF sensor [hydrothermal vent metagenome]|uniref:Diguanylate cyclase with GAF sensor n=1 Tax=hydrothermal vent metagenome TaxID=652676 RepID=A0A1W1BZ41_9ZZZZ
MQTNKKSDTHIAYQDESYFNNTPSHLSADKWQRTVNLLAKIFNAPGAWIMQANTKGMEALYASEGIQNTFPAGLVFEQHINIYCKTVMDTKTRLYVKNAKEEGTWDDNPEYTEAGFISYIGVPLQWPNGNMFGTLCVLDTHETDYNEDFSELLWQLKELIDSDLHNLTLIKKLQKSNITDELTSINNRRGFLQKSKSLIQLAKRNNLQLSLMYCDLNNLKSTNDLQGHKIGDFLIESFALALKESLRDEDIVARLGGDEFCFMGIYNSQDKKQTIISRIQKRFEFLTKDEPKISQASFSAGFRTFSNIEGFNIEKMISEVDNLMYENKQLLKNKKSV